MKKNAYYELLFRASLEAIVTVDQHFRIIEANSRFVKLFKLPEDTLVGKPKSFLTVIKQDQSEMTRCKDLLLQGEIYKTESVCVDRDGNALDVIVTGIPIVESDIFKGAFLLYKDITREKQAQIELNKQMMIFEALFKNSSDAIIRHDSQHKIIEINENFEKLFGYELLDIQNRDLDHIFISEKGCEPCVHLTQKVLGGERISIEGVRRGKTGKAIAVQIKGIPIIAEGKVIGGYGIYTDISERKRAEEEILYISYHDQLTGVYNRRFFEEELHRMDTTRNMPMALIMADVNGLKLTNDAFGHGMGDALLKRLAEILVLNCRSGEIISRLGGDEFVILMPGTTAQEAEQVVRRIQKSCRDERFNSISLSMSFGWDEKKQVDEPLSNLFKRVEDYMYSHKLVESPSVRGKMFETIIRTLHEKNKREERHSSRVSLYCEAIGNAMQLNAREVEGLKMAGWLHDIGKIAVDENILNKKGRLSQEEWFEVKKHPEVCYSILSSVNELSELANSVLAHHERFDGKGYPKGLMGEEIPIGARIISVADSYDAMTTARAYCSMRTKKDAMAELQKHAGTQFDPEVVNVFVNHVLKA